MLTERKSSPQIPQFLLRSHTGFLFPIRFLWLVKHAWLRKCLSQSAHGIRTPVDTHGGLAMQLLHVWSQLGVRSRERPCRTFYTLTVWSWLLSVSLSHDNVLSPRHTSSVVRMLRPALQICHHNLVQPKQRSYIAENGLENVPVRGYLRHYPG